jgi:hypothetical protein
MSICGTGHVCISDNLWDVTGAMSHIFGAATWVLGVTLLLRPVWRMRWSWLLTGSLLVIYALIKELWIDETWENADEAGRAWVDILTLLSGGILGWLLSLTMLEGYGTCCSMRRRSAEYAAV